MAKILRNLQNFFRIFFHSLWHVCHLRGDHRICSIQARELDGRVRTRYFCECGYRDDGETWEEALTEWTRGD